MLEVVLEKVSRSFDGRQVLRDLDLGITAGERLLVRGRNGSGKTTLLKILAGLLRPTTGKVRILEGGRDWEGADRQRHLGYLSPDLVLYEEFSALENLRFFGRVRGLEDDAARDQAVLARVGLSERARDPLGTLSSGLRQRAKLAFALQPAPRVLLLDEPGSNLDTEGRASVRRIVQEADVPGRILVLATNDPEEFDLAPRVLDLGGGGA
jgi:heme exporter protein A